MYKRQDFVYSLVDDLEEEVEKVKVLLINLIVLYLSHCFVPGFLGNVMTSDDKCMLLQTKKFCSYCINCK